MVGSTNSMWLQLVTGTSNRRANFVATLSYQESKVFLVHTHECCWTMLFSITVSCLGFFLSSPLWLSRNSRGRRGESNSVITKLSGSTWSQPALSLVDRRQLHCCPNPFPASIDRNDRLRPAMHRGQAGSSGRRQRTLLLFLYILLIHPPCNDCSYLLGITDSTDWNRLALIKKLPVIWY